MVDGFITILINSCKENLLNKDKSSKIKAFVRNKNKFIVNKKVKNFPKNTDMDFLKDFNITPCDRNAARENQAEKSCCFLDNAFTGTNTRTPTQEQILFQDATLTYLYKHTSKLKIAALNINSIRNKFGEILLMLNKQTIDVLVIGESKLNITDDTKDFSHSAYELIRRDRTGKGVGGVLVYVKQNLKPSKVICDQVSEIINFTVIRKLV